MENPSLKRRFGCDRVGNCWVDTGEGQTVGFTPENFTPVGLAAFNGANRMVGYGYDQSGNLAAMGSHGMTYDGENRMRESTINSVTFRYVYDGEGRRVMKLRRASQLPPGAAETVESVYVYDAQGQLAVEQGPRETGTAGCTTCYRFGDHLGSTRLVTDANGSVVALRDYLPYGEQIRVGVGGRQAVYGAALGSTLGFTGKERNAEEPGLDYFGARYFSAAQGRFTSPDAPFADQFVEDPQTWNLYSYVRNNPMRLIDDDGRGAKEFIHGLFNATWTNATGGIGRAKATHPHERMGQRVGDAVSVVGAGIEMAFGSTLVGGGGGACSSGGGCLAGAPAIAVGTAITSHGVLVGTTGLANFMQSFDDSAGATESEASSLTKPEAIADEIEKGGYQVKANPKAPGQEGNVTITHPNDSTRKLNIRVETGPIPGSSKPVRHANVQVIKTSESGNKRQVRNKHIIEEEK
jgi:RHS repeat-associated protein